MSTYSWQQFLKDSSDVPRKSDGTVDYTATFLNILVPQRQIVQMIMALLRLVAAKAPNRSKWSYVTSWSVSETVGEAVAAGVFEGVFTLQRGEGASEERVQLTFGKASAALEVGLGLGLLPITITFSKEDWSSAGALLLTNPTADFELIDFSKSGAALILDGGAGTGSYLGVLLLGVDAALENHLTTLRKDIAGRKWLKAMGSLALVLMDIEAGPLFRGALFFSGHEAMANVSLNVTLMVGVPVVQLTSPSATVSSPSHRTRGLRRTYFA